MGSYPKPLTVLLIGVLDRELFLTDDNEFRKDAQDIQNALVLTLEYTDGLEQFLDEVNRRYEDLREKQEFRPSEIDYQRMYVIPEFEKRFSRQEIESFFRGTVANQKSERLETEGVQ